MGTLTGLDSNYIVTLIRENIVLFNLFDEVYLFGSALDSTTPKNDVDILLIYSEYSDSIIEVSRRILQSLECIIGIPVDLTVLSVEEENDTHFLNRISPRYLRLK